MRTCNKVDQADAREISFVRARWRNYRCSCARRNYDRAAIYDSTVNFLAMIRRLTDSVRSVVLVARLLSRVRNSNEKALSIVPKVLNKIKPTWFVTNSLLPVK